MISRLDTDELLQELRDIEMAMNESSIVTITNAQGTILYANDKFTNLSQYSKEELIGSNQSIVNSGYHDREFFKQMWRTIGTGNVWHGEIKNKAKDGSYYWVDTTIVPFLNEKGKPYKYISIRHDITKIKEYRKHMEEKAYYDYLTLLPNKNYLDKWLEEIFYEDFGKEITVMFVDFDRFKSINDKLGHHVGDKVIKELANRLKESICERAFITRQGGDEFLIILRDIKEKEEVIPLVENIIERVSSPFYIDNETINSTLSIGISTGKISGEKKDFIRFIDRLITKADNAMYYAKKVPGNSYYFSKDDSEINRFHEIDFESRNALFNNEFYIVYQPIINLETNTIDGVEALLRWNNKTLGNITPGEFIPFLEDSGMIIPVGNWVIRTVSKQIKEWEKKGIKLKRVAVNISPVQFNNKSFIEDIKNIFKEEDIIPEMFEFEITEGTVLDVEKSKKVLLNLNELGIKISIDDFGTGYSSLSYLNNLQIDNLKIDKSFLDNLDTNKDVIVNTIITMGKNLNFNVIAEGIENEEQLLYLRENNCNEGQGYFFSKPISSEEFIELYNKNN